ncbi:MAG: BspA family leucine-rich repeat surface protein, partial [Anaerovoracaceae bacterium]
DSSSENYSGYAYAVLSTDDTDSSKWKLTFVRSYDKLEDGTEQTVETLSGSTISGTVYSGIESENYYYHDSDDRSDPPWIKKASDIRRVIFDGSIRPASTCEWFRGMEDLTQIDHPENLNTSIDTDMSYMFAGSSSLTSLDLSGFNTRSLTTMRGMFSGCSALQSVTMNVPGTKDLTDMSELFDGCENLTKVDFSGFNTINVTDFSAMLRGCRSLKSVDLSAFRSDWAVDMHEMFSGCSALTELDLSSFDTDRVTDFSGMFSGCSELTDLDVSTFETPNAVDLSEMFAGCGKIETLDLCGFDLSKAESLDGMFDGTAADRAVNVDAAANGSDSAALTCYAASSSTDRLNDSSVTKIDPAKLRFIPGAHIVFRTFGGSSVAVQTGTPGFLSVRPEDPTKEGFFFDGWCTDPQNPKEYSFGTPVNGSLTLYAMWSTPKSRIRNTLSTLSNTREKHDPSGSTFSPLRLRGSGSSNKRVSITWSRVSKAETYAVLGAICGGEYRKVAESSRSTTCRFSSLAGKKLKKGSYYKFIAAAFDKNGRLLAVSKTVYLTVPGGKYGNVKSVRITNVKKSKKTLKKGTAFRLKAKTSLSSKKLKAKKYRGLRFESSNPNVAKVSSKGRISAKQKGTAIIYAYTQNGKSAKVQVRVK